jgi:hypothetical protein
MHQPKDKFVSNLPHLQKSNCIFSILAYKFQNTSFLLQNQSLDLFFIKSQFLKQNW